MDLNLCHKIFFNENRARKYLAKNVEKMGTNFALAVTVSNYLLERDVVPNVNIRSIISQVVGSVMVVSVVFSDFH